MALTMSKGDQVGLGGVFRSLKPTAPDLPSFIDPKTGLIQSQYQVPIDPATGMLDQRYLLGDKYDQQYNDVLNMYKQRTLLPEDQASAAAKALQEQLGLSTNSQIENAMTSSANRAAEGRGQAARQGGASGGMLANLNRLSQRDLNRDLQGIRSSSAQQSLGITAQDLANRQGMLQSLLGEEGKNRAFLQTREGTNIQNSLTGLNANIERSLNEQNYSRDSQQKKYEEEMRGWAAEKQAQATANSGKK